MRLEKITSKKHPGAIFFKVAGTKKDFICKFYPGKSEEAEAFREAIENEHPVDVLKAICREWLPHLDIDEASFERVKQLMNETTDPKSVPMAVCHDHKEEYLTPLICTLAFRKAEFWCPYCGRTYGYLSPDPHQQTDELQRRHDLYEFASRKYLRAHAAIQGGAQIKLDDGNYYQFHELPSELKEEYTALLEAGWQTGEEAETLYDGDYLQDFVHRRTGLEPKDLQCPREKSDTTPCAARDGNTAVCDIQGTKSCVGCEKPIVDLVHTEVIHWKEKKQREREQNDSD